MGITVFEEVAWQDSDHLRQAHRRCVKALYLACAESKGLRLGVVSVYRRRNREDDVGITLLGRPMTAQCLEWAVPVLREDCICEATG